MSVTIATRPIYPLAGEVWVSFTTTLGDSVRVYAEEAPDGSATHADITKAAGPVLVHEGDADRAWKWAVDKPGRYIVRVDELDRDATAYAGGWRGSPSASVSETVVSSQSLAIVVGQPLKQALGWGKNRGELIVHLFDDHIRPLTVAIHGEESPRLSNASTLMQTATVQAAVDALANVASATALASIATLAAAYATAFDVHVASTTYHHVMDATNGMPASIALVSNPASLGQWIAQAQDRLKRHIQDYKEGATPADTGFGKGGYHSATTTEGFPQAPGPSDAAGCLVALGDLIAAFDLHRVSTTAHLVTDPNVVVGTPPTDGTLTAVHYRVAKALRLVDTSLTDTEHSATPALVATGGFAKS